MIKISTQNLLSAFSLALDLAENKIMGHAKRTAYLALNISSKLGLKDKERNNIYAAAFLHDIGVTGAKKDYHQDMELLKVHPEIGSKIVEKLPLDPRVTSFVRWHHVNWDGSNAPEALTQEVPLGAQIVYLADQIDLRYDKSKLLYDQKEAIINWVKESSGTLFNPEIVRAFLELAVIEKFWLDYNFYDIDQILRKIEPKSEAEINLKELEDISIAFATVIDNKSKFTLDHSQGLAQLIEKTTKEYGLSDELVKKAKIAGLLHDLGKLAIPNHILDKPGKLTENEYGIIKSHTYYTKAILGMVDGFNEIKEWAGNHHETLDGQGYPEAIEGSKLSLIERLMSVCDVYQALTEERPYRKPLAQSEVFSIIQGMVGRNKLCNESFDILKRTVS